MSDNSESDYDSDDSGRGRRNMKLLDAAQSGITEDVKKLIQEGADILVVDDRSRLINFKFFKFFKNVHS